MPSEAESSAQSIGTICGLGEIHVWRVGRDRQDLSAQTHLLSADERERAGKFHDPKEQERFTASRVALRRILGGYLGAPPERIEFGYESAGKPYLKGADGIGLSFNLSHSGLWCLVAAGYFDRIGVDIEETVPNRNLHRIARRFFTTSEADALDALPHEIRSEAFYACWARKEAYAKAVGGGLGIGMSRFEVSAARDMPAKLLKSHHEPSEHDAWTLFDLQIEPGYAAALAVHGEPSRLLLRSWPNEA